MGHCYSVTLHDVDGDVELVRYFATEAEAACCGEREVADAAAVGIGGVTYTVVSRELN